MPNSDPDSVQEPDPVPENEPSGRMLRRIGSVGRVLFLGWAGFLLAAAILQPDPYADGWRLVLGMAFLGPLVSISDGVVSGFSSPYLLVQNIFQDIILVLLLYPFIVQGYRRRLRFNFIGRQIDRIRAVAERHKRRVRPFGAVGLLLFLLLPFWGSGPLVGSTVGYLIGLRTQVALAAVFTGHVLSISILVLFFDVVHEKAESFSRTMASYLPWVVGGIFLTVAVVRRFVAPYRAARAAGTAGTIGAPEGKN